VKVAVIFGGTSEERDVSIASGSQVITALKQAGHEVVAIDTARGALEADEVKRLQNFQVLDLPPNSGALAEIKSSSPVSVFSSMELEEVDVVFIALHGGSGEDGSLQALLELSDIPFTGSGHVGSTLAMDKDVSKRIMRAAGVPTPDWQMWSPTDTSVDNRLGYPVIVKPNAQGSTVGLSLVSEAAELQAAIEKARQFGNEVMLETFIAGRELTVGILEDQALAVGEIIVSSEIFDYQSKYQNGAAEEVFPAEITAEQTLEIQQLGLRVHQALKLNAYSRVDFRMDETGALWVLEANTVPGLTAMSLLPQSAKAAGIEFSELCDRICWLAVARHTGTG
jgi:D-alanine-D-alanine ligase